MKLLRITKGFIADPAMLKFEHGHLTWNWSDSLNMKATATIRLRFPSKQKLLAVFEALEPETRSSVTGRSKVTIAREDRTLMLTLVFTAKDTSALRAAVNSYLHWARLTMDALESMSLSRNA